MDVKKKILTIYNWGFLSKDKVDANQKKIREVEWDAVKPYIPTGSSFLDVGCGAGYAMKKATEELKCDAFGIDPQPGGHGVGRYSELDKTLKIIQGVSGKIPFEDKTFDVVYSSHVLEHVRDEQKSLQEMNRVLKNNGVLIIGMPTATMARINNLSQILFTTHQRVFNVLFEWIPFITTGKTSFINMLIPESHSSPRAKTIFYDMRHYRIKSWRKTVEKNFKIDQVLTPALYPFPEYRQMFKMKKNARLSSSVFFVCRKKSLLISY
ncbi:MAG: class I SAM-dependent methyltransferase [Salinivirgaceae bacterium]|nr:class I SAM-dependent methyltransferase [Salinivirgaceae bacterium]